MFSNPLWTIPAIGRWSECMEAIYPATSTAITTSIGTVAKRPASPVKPRVILYQARDNVVRPFRIEHNSSRRKDLKVGCDLLVGKPLLYCRFPQEFWGHITLSKRVERSAPPAVVDVTAT